VNPARNPLFSLSDKHPLPSRHPSSHTTIVVRIITQYKRRLFPHLNVLDETVIFFVIKKLKVPVAFYRSPSGG
jgi:hypothetical protein